MGKKGVSRRWTARWSRRCRRSTRGKNFCENRRWSEWTKYWNSDKKCSW